MNILIVEDNIVIQLFLEQIISDLGFNVVGIWDNWWLSPSPVTMVGGWVMMLEEIRGEGEESIRFIFTCLSCGKIQGDAKDSYSGHSSSCRFFLRS